MDARYRSEFANGVLVGVVTIPVGVPAGVLVAGFPVVMVLANLVPIVLAAVLIAIGLWRVPDAMTKGFLVLGKFLVVIISLALAVGSFEFLTGRGPCRPAENSPPVMDGMTIVAQICLFLMGAFVLMDLIVRVGGRPLASFGRVLGINEVASGGSVVTMADAIPTFQMMKDMDRRGVFLSTAWSISAMAVLGPSRVHRRRGAPDDRPHDHRRARGGRSGGAGRLRHRAPSLPRLPSRGRGARSAWAPRRSPLPLPSRGRGARCPVPDRTGFEDRRHPSGGGGGGGVNESVFDVVVIGAGVVRVRHRP